MYGGNCCGYGPIHLGNREPGLVELGMESLHTKKYFTGGSVHGGPAVFRQ